MEYTFLSRKTITDSDFKVNASQGNARLMLNTRPNLALKQLPGFQDVSSVVKTTIVTPQGALIAQGTLIVNPKSSRLSLNQAKTLFQDAAVKTGDKYDMYACVHNGQLNLKLIKAATSAAPLPGPTPLRKRRAPGVEKEHQNNTQVAPPSNSAPDFEFAPQEAAQNAPFVPTAATAPVRAARAKRTPRLRKVLPNKRISGSATSAEPVVAPAPEINFDANITTSSGPSSFRGKRKNAGRNRRYSDDEYVVKESEEEAPQRQKRRRTSSDSDSDNNANQQVATSTMMAKAAEPPTNFISLIEAAEVYKTLTVNERIALKALMELEEQSHISNQTLGPALARLAEIAVAVASGEIDLNLASSMELD